MRPTPYKRCKAVEDKIIKRIREGASFSDAPRLEGIDEATFRRWRQCEKENEDASLSLRDRRCWDCANCTLQSKCDTAESHFRQSCLEVIHKAGKKNWRAMAWILERRYRNEYTTRTIIEVADEEKRLPDPTEELLKAIWSGVNRSHRRRESQNLAAVKPL
jgi:hypothetical protein